MNLLFFDLETTGLPLKNGNQYLDPKISKYYKTSRIIEIAWIIIEIKEDNESINKPIHILTKKSFLIYPKDFVITNTIIHGIDMENVLTNGLFMENVLKEFEKDLDLFNINKIISHNIEFDYNILLSECYNNNSKSLIDKLNSIKKRCSMYEGRKKMNVSKFPKLTELYNYLFNEDIQQKHRALNDTELCMKCYLKLYDYDYN